MSALRTVRCPACGTENLLGRACACGGKASSSKARRASFISGRAVGVMLTLLLTPAAIIGCSLALAESGRPGYGIAVAVGAWIIATLWRLGLDHDEGIDVRQLLFPAPFDWHIKFESLQAFWLSERPYFRAAYIGCALALVVVVILVVVPMRKG